MKTHELLKEGDTLVVGVSGGCDSVYLLRTLLTLGCRCVATHCNFHLRGEESNRDEHFVRNLCEELGVPLLVKNFETEKHAEENGISIEMAARNLRYEWFERVRQEYGAAAIAVAHHADDNIETMLLNLMRGTGVKGLAGMRPKRDRVIRPLLCVSRQEIVEEMERNGWKYVTDSTNLEPNCQRNKIRLWLLPLMEQMSPSIRKTLMKEIDVFREQSEALDEMEETNANSGYSYYLTYRGYGFNRTQTDGIRRAVQEGRTGAQFTSASHRVLVNRGEVLIDVLKTERKEKQYELARETMDREDNLAFSNDVLMADASKIREPLILRKWRAGDSLQPYGMHGKRKKVSDVLVDCKVSLRDKENVQVVEDGDGDVIWVVGLRSSEKVKVEEQTKKIVKCVVVEK